MKPWARSKSGFRGEGGARRSKALAIRSTKPPIGSYKFIAASLQGPLPPRCKA
jgi:hypothetical protein